MSTNYHHGFRSVYKLTAQVVFVIKYRRKAINNEILARLKEIFASTLSKWESALLDFNGESDHVHLIIDYKPDIAALLDWLFVTCYGSIGGHKSTKSLSGNRFN
jgi:putative transposase